MQETQIYHYWQLLEQNDPTAATDAFFQITTEFLGLLPFEVRDAFLARAVATTEFTELEKLFSNLTVALNIAEPTFTAQHFPLLELTKAYMARTKNRLNRLEFVELMEFLRDRAEI